MLERLSRKRVLTLNHFYLRLRPTISIALIPLCHTHFSEENRMHLICVSGLKFHTYDRLMSVISQNNAQMYRKGLLTFITLTRVDSKVFTRTMITMKMRLHLHLQQAFDWLIAFLITSRSRWSTPLRGSSLNSVSKDEYTYGWYSARPQK
jgi:hypothetical protein